MSKYTPAITSKSWYETNNQRKEKETMRKFIVCIIDPTNNSYDYDLDGAWTDNLDTLQLWVNAGINQFAILDSLSMELVVTYDNEDLQEYINGIRG